jgi:DNA-binding transcriptional LysR family regulator
VADLTGHNGLVVRNVSQPAKWPMRRENDHLVELFPENRIIASHIYIVFPERKNLPLKTRTFIEHVRAEFRTSIPWAEAGASSPE